MGVDVLPPVRLSSTVSSCLLRLFSHANIVFSYNQSMGPIAPTADGIIPNGNGLAYNPRCIRRDISQYISSRWGTTKETVDLITKPKNIYDFQMYMQGNPAAGFVGVHTAGHYTMGGDPGGDLFTSPGDPAFWVHHGMIDRVW